MQSLLKADQNSLDGSLLQRRALTPSSVMGLVNPSDTTMSDGNKRLVEVLKASLDPRTNKEGQSLLFSSQTRPSNRCSGDCA